MLKSLVEPKSDTSSLRFRVVDSLYEMLGLEEIAREALAESRFNAAQFSSEKFRKAAERAANDLTRHGVLVASRSDRPVGVAYCNIGELMFATGLLITTVQILYVKHVVRGTLLGGKVANGLLNGTLSWNRARKGDEVLIHLTSGIRSAQTHRLLKRRGFRTVGGGYVKSA